MMAASVAGSATSPLVAAEEEPNPASFTSVFLQSGDLLPLLFAQLAFLERRVQGAQPVGVVDLVQMAAVCKMTRPPIQHVLRWLWVPEMPKGYTVIYPPDSGLIINRIEPLTVFVAVIPDTGRVLVSDACRRHISEDTESPSPARVLELPAPSALGICAVHGPAWGRETFQAAHFLPAGLAVSSDGRTLYVVSAEPQGVTSLHISKGPDPGKARARPEGEISTGERERPLSLTRECYHRGEGILDYPLGCALSADEKRLFVVDSDNHRVVAIRPLANVPSASSPLSVLYAFGSTGGVPGSGTGELHDPYDCAVRDGHVYVTDSGNNRLAVFAESDGTFVCNLGIEKIDEATDPAGIDFLADGRLVVASGDSVLIFALPDEVGVTTLRLLQRIRPNEASMLRTRRGSVEGRMAGVCVDETSPLAPRILVANSGRHVWCLTPIATRRAWTPARMSCYEPEWSAVSESLGSAIEMAPYGSLLYPQLQAAREVGSVYTGLP